MYFGRRIRVMLAVPLVWATVGGIFSMVPGWLGDACGQSPAAAADGELAEPVVRLGLVPFLVPSAPEYGLGMWGLDGRLGEAQRLLAGDGRGVVAVTTQEGIWAVNPSGMQKLLVDAPAAKAESDQWWPPQVAALSPYGFLVVPGPDGDLYAAGGQVSWRRVALWSEIAPGGGGGAADILAMAVTGSYVYVMLARQVVSVDLRFGEVGVVFDADANEGKIPVALSPIGQEGKVLMAFGIQGAASSGTEGLDGMLDWAVLHPDGNLVQERYTPALSAPLMRGKLAPAGEHGHFALLEDGRVVHLSSSQGAMVVGPGPWEFRGAVAAVATMNNHEDPEVFSLASGCEDVGFVQTSDGILMVETFAKTPRPGTVLVAVDPRADLAVVGPRRGTLPFWRGDRNMNPMRSPVDVSFMPNGDLAVADRGANSVFRLWADGTGFGAIRNPLGSPVAVAPDGVGGVMMVDWAPPQAEGPSLIRFFHDGTHHLLLDGDPLGLPVKIIADGEGRFLIADRQRGVLSVGLDGEASVVWAGNASSVVRLPDGGELVVATYPADHGGPVLLKLKPDGAAGGGALESYVEEAVVVAEGNLEVPVDLAVLPDGTLIILDLSLDPVVGDVATAGVLAFDEASGQLVPYAVSALIPKAYQGGGLAVVAGAVVKPCWEEQRWVLSQDGGFSVVNLDAVDGAGCDCGLTGQNNGVTVGPSPRFFLGGLALLLFLWRRRLCL